MHERGLAFQWQDGYGGFSVSLSQLDKVTAYIRNQREHHKKVTLALLKKAGVPYEPKYVLGRIECRASGAPGCWDSP
jgi:putative transposase